MKLRNTLVALTALALAGVSNAQTTTINITGATAFRVAAVKSIVASFGANLTDVAHNGTSTSSTGHEGAQYSIFRGTFAGITGTTVVRAQWSGSVEGINDVANQNDVNFLTEAAFAGTNTYSSALLPAGANKYYNTGAGASPAKVKFTFSDVFPTSSPYDVSNLTDSQVGIVPFFFVVNDGTTPAFTNMQAEKFGVLADAGFKKLSFFQDVTADNNVELYLTGRNDGSGTRTTYLACSRGQLTNGANGSFTTPIKQYKNNVITTDEADSLQLWPNPDGTNSSTVWGNSNTGNGGYSSSGPVGTLLTAKTSNVQIRTAAGAASGARKRVAVGAAIGLSDAQVAINGGGRVLSWNGTSVTVPTSGALAATEQDKFRTGQYTFWGYEHFIYYGTLSADETTFFNAITTNIAANLGASGIAKDGLFTVSRADDGAPVK